MDTTTRIQLQTARDNVKAAKVAYTLYCNPDTFTVAGERAMQQAIVDAQEAFEALLTALTTA